MNREEQPESQGPVGRVRGRARRRWTVAAILVGCLAGVIAIAWAIQERHEDRSRFLSVQPGVLYRSRQPEPEELRQGLKRRNITTVVNLRTVQEDRAAFEQEKLTCEQLGVRFINIPISAALPTPEQIEEFLRIIRGNLGAVLVHCQYGRSRTGMMVATYRVVVEGKTPDQVARDEVHGRVELRPADATRMEELLRRLHAERDDWLRRTAPPMTAPRAGGPA